MAILVFQYDAVAAAMTDALVERKYCVTAVFWRCLLFSAIRQGRRPPRLAARP